MKQPNIFLSLCQLFFNIIVLIVRLHVARPLWTASFYLGLIAFQFAKTGGYVHAIFTLAVIALLWKFLRIPLARRLRRRQYARWVHMIMAQTLWSDEDIKPQRFATITETPMAGVWKVDLETPLGQADEDIIKILPKFRAGLKLSDTILLADENPYDGVVSVLFCESNPLETVLDSAAAPVLHMAPTEKNNPYHWLPIGVDAHGGDYEVPLFLEEGGSVRQLCAGMSGSGKSSIVRQQLLQGVLNPHIDVAIFDGKGSEFGLFEPYVQAFGRTPTEFWKQLRYLEDEISRRGKVLNDNKMLQNDRVSQSWNPADDGNFLLWVWDEIGVTMAGFDNKQRFEAQTRLYGILSVARSLGVAAVLSSQTFKSDLLSTQIRDNCFDVSLGYKMNSNQEAAYIGFDVSDDISPANIRGKIMKSGKSATVGTFAMKGIDRDAFGRSYFITDKQIKAQLSSLEPINVPVLSK